MYGTCRLAEGADVAGRTGRADRGRDHHRWSAASRDGRTQLRERGAEVRTVVCAIDRSPPPFFGSPLPLAQGVSFAGLAIAPLFAIIRFFPPVVTGVVITTIG